MAFTWSLKPLTPGPYPKPDYPCHQCPLGKTMMGFGYPAIYNGGNGVLFVVEALGENEVLEGLPLVGSAGWQFNHILKRAGLQREDFAGIDNVIHCRPPQNKLSGMSYEHSAIQHCKELLDATIEQVRPKAIVAMGNIPLRRLTGQSSISRNRGFIFDNQQGIPVVGTFHPSFLLPRKKEKSASKYTWVVIMDIRKALRVAQGQREVFPQQYLLDPSPDQALQFVGEYERTQDVKLAWDLETVYKLKTKNEQKLKLEEKQQITRISFAFRSGYAMTIPWMPEYVTKVIGPLFRMNRDKVGHNSHGFDEPIILLQEKMEMSGTLLDNMDAFHVLQPNLDRNLEFVTSLMTDHIAPWKHMSQAEPEFYSCVDADATITSFNRITTMMKKVEVPEYGTV